jgi:ligand-binding SRPBCC domain-containing protein
MAVHVQFEHWVAMPVEKVFAFFSDPNNLPRIMPPSTGTRNEKMTLLSPPGSADPANAAGIGSEIVTSFRALPFLPFRFTWIALITEFKRNERFADRQTKGPFKHFFHVHEFRSETRGTVQGTLVRDVIEFEVGLGPIGKIAERCFVLPQLRRTFRYRQKKVEELLTKSTR